MPYIDLAGLSRYASRQKERLERDCALLRDMQWLRTEKAGAVTCWPVGGTPLKPSVDFLFAETPPASGDKSPENPSTISGVSEVKVVRKGKNLSVVRSSKTHNGVTFTSNGDGTYTVNGTASGGTAQLDLITKSNKVPAMTGKPVMPSGCPAGGDLQTYSTYVSAHDINGTWRQSVYDGGNGTTPLVPNQDGVFVYSILIKSGTTVSNLLFKPQLEYGDVATAFEEPEGTSYTIPLGNTYYGGTLDVASGVMTATHTSMTVDGTLSYSSSTFYEGADYYRIGFYPAVQRPITGTIPVSDIACDILPVTPQGEATNVDCFYFPRNSAVIRIYMTKATLGLGDGASYSTVVNAYNSYFTAHPAQLVYPVRTPTTVQLTPTEILSLAQADKYTPRLNTVYTDASAVQVGYVKSPIREEYELTQAIAAQGGNV